jgi:hypothetical protein
MTTAMTRATIAIVRVSMARPDSVSRAVSPDPPSGTPLPLTHGLGVSSGSSQARARDDHRALRLARCPLPPRSDAARVRATRRGGSELVRSGRERGARGDARIADERKPLDGEPQIGVEGDSGASMRRLASGCRHCRAGDASDAEGRDSVDVSVAAPRAHGRDEWLRAVAPAAPSVPVARGSALLVRRVERGGRWSAFTRASRGGHRLFTRDRRRWRRR